MGGHVVSMSELDKAANVPRFVAVVFRGGCSLTGWIRRMHNLIGCIERVYNLIGCIERVPSPPPLPWDCWDWVVYTGGE